MCGIVGLFTSDVDKGLEKVIHGLSALHTRGQDSAGIAIIDLDTKDWHYIKDERNHNSRDDLINESFRRRAFENLTDLKRENGSTNHRYLVLGQTKYTTSHVGSVLDNTQPVVVKRPNGKIGIFVHNGNIPYLENLISLVENPGESEAQNDTKWLVDYFLESVEKYGVEAAGQKLMRNVKGAYSLMGWYDGDFFAMRDPWGIRPLGVGAPNGDILFGSESSVVRQLGGIYLREIERGEYIFAENSEISSNEMANGVPNILTQNNLRFCAFEDIYFKRSSSHSNNPEVSNAKLRMALGKGSFDYYGSEASLVVPVLNSGRSGAQGFSHASGLPETDALIKEGVIRTFIEEEGYRKAGQLDDLLFLEDQHIELPDDTSVRKNVIVKVAAVLLYPEYYNGRVRNGPKFLDFKILAPPITRLCQFGIDMQTNEELGMYSLIQDGIIEIGPQGAKYDIDQVNEAYTLKVKEHVHQIMEGQGDPEKIRVRFLPFDLFKKIMESVTERTYDYACMTGISPLTGTVPQELLTVTEYSGNRAPVKVELPTAG